MYQIVKGWPNDGVLDIAYPADAALEADEGIICSINAAGNAAPCVNPADGFVHGWLLGREGVKDMCTVLIGNFVIEVSIADYCETGTYTPGCSLTVSANSKFTAAESGDVTVGEVISIDKTGKNIRVYWHC